MILINSSPKDALKIFQSFLPISVPIGVGCLAAALEVQGIAVKIIDEQVEENIELRIKEYVETQPRPLIFGFSVLTVALKSALILAKRLKAAYPDCIIIFGGIHPTAMPDEVMAYDYVDFVLRGEAERSLVEFYNALANKASYASIAGLSYRAGEKIIHNPYNFITDSLDTYPPFPYHMFAHNPRYDLGFVVSSRGCPYRCIFCSNRVTTGKKYRHKSSSFVVDELESIHMKYGRNFAIFVDDNLLVSKERIYSLIEAIKARGLDKKMTFAFQSRGDNVDEKILRDLFECGFKSIFFGMETSSEEVMKIIKKDETVAECVAAAKLAKKIGYHLSATFIYGFRGETREDRMNCVSLSREIGLDMVRYNNATPYPGTELYDIAKKEGRLNVVGVYENLISVSTFIENPFKNIPFSYVPTGVTEDEIRRDILFSYFSFYLNFARLKPIFAKPGQGVGWFNAGDGAKGIVKKLPALVLLGALLGVKFLKLFYYMVINKTTRVPFGEFLKVFDGLRRGTDS